MENEFSVYQFFEDDSYECYKRWVSNAEAVKAAIFLSTNVASKIGTTKRVIITDGGDHCVWEWKFGEGIVFPNELKGKLK